MGYPICVNRPINMATVHAGTFKGRQERVGDQTPGGHAKAGFAELEEALDTLPQSYTQHLYAQKCSAVYHHVYESAYGEGTSVYSVAA